MAAPAKSVAHKGIPGSRRRRRFGLNYAILSNINVYLNPCPDSNTQSSLEEAALFAMAARHFNEPNS